MKSVIVLLLGTLLVTGCTQSPELFGIKSEIPKIKIVVINENYSDANVYFLRYGTGFSRIGFITGHSGPTTFSTSESINQEIDVKIHIKLIGSNKSFTTEFFSISADQVIELTIGNPLRYSHFVIL